MADLAAVVSRARAVGALVLVDGTQAVPQVPLNDLIDGVDYLVVAGYKHLLYPRGVAFQVVGPGRTRGTAIRFSTHVGNDEADIERVVALGGTLWQR